MISKNRHGVPGIFWTLALLWVGSTSVAKAATYAVPANYGTIQSAISDSGVVNGDVIVISPGTYLENLDFLGKAITLTSTDPNDPVVVAHTIIDGSAPIDPNRASVVSFVNAEGANSVLSGLTLQNGLGQTDGTIGFDRSAIFTGSNGDGGAVLCRASSPTITKNIIKNNQTQYGGGGIFCHGGASPAITQNRFINNAAVYYGGAIFCRINCQPTITNNIFIGNHCGTLGGAIYLADHSDAQISGNWFESNSSTNLSGGAIYYFVSSNPTIASNIFWKNTARTTGSAIMVSGSSGKIFNNTFIGNKILVSSTFEATLAIYSNCLLANNIIMGSTGGGLFTGSGAVPVILNNGFWNNSAGHYRGNVADQTGLAGNIAIDPVLGANLPSPFTAFELEPNSPCRDAGTNLVQQLSVDYDGSPRVVHSGVDMGAQEFNAVAVPQDYATIQAAMNAASENDTVLVSPGFYQENLNFNGKNLVLRSLNPLDPNCVAQTIIDGGQNGRCVTLDSGETKSSVIAGLTIQNGFADGNVANKAGPIYGGGIYINDPNNAYPSPGATVLYNHIHHNQSRSYGGGIDSRFHVDVFIAFNRVEYNTTLERSGGGIHVAGDTVCKIVNNYIGHNSSASTIGQGGGIYVFNTSYVEIVGNEICHNIGGEGGGIYILHSDGLIEGNIIRDNVAFDDGGGGIAVSQFVTGKLLDLTIRNNVISGNEATSTISGFNGEGGGILVFSIGATRIINNTLVGNSTPAGKGAGITSAIRATPLIQNNIVVSNRTGLGVKTYPQDPNATTASHPILLANNVWNNGTTGLDNFGGSLTDLTGVDGHISVDPIFVRDGFLDDNGTPADPNDDFWNHGDYRLGYFSSCRDTGLAHAVVTSDLRGISRPQFMAYDIGAFEVELYDFSANGSVDGTDLMLMTQDWLQPGSAMPLDLNGDGIINYLDIEELSQDWLKDAAN